MNAFVIATVLAVLGVANAGLIGSGLVSPLGVRSGLIDNAGPGLVAPGLIGARTIATGISAPAISSTVVSGSSGTIVDNRNLGLNSGIVGYNGLGLIGARSIAAPAIDSTVVSGPSGTIVENRNIGLNSGIIGAGLINNAGLGLVSAPGVIAARSLAGDAILGNNGLVLKSGLGWANSGIWNGAPGLVARSGLVANQWW